MKELLGGSERLPRSALIWASIVVEFEHDAVAKADTPVQKNNLNIEMRDFKVKTGIDSKSDRDVELDEGVSAAGAATEGKKSSGKATPPPPPPASSSSSHRYLGEENQDDSESVSSEEDEDEGDGRGEEEEEYTMVNRPPQRLASKMLDGGRRGLLWRTFSYLLMGKQELLPHVFNTASKERQKRYKFVGALADPDPANAFSPKTKSSISVIHKFPAHADRITAMEVAPSENSLITASASGELKCWSLASTPEMVKSFSPSKSPVTSVKFVRDGDRVVCCNGSLSSWDLVSGTVDVEMTHTSGNPFLAVEMLPASFPGGGSVMGSVVIASDAAGNVSCIDFRAPRKISVKLQVDQHQAPLALASKPCYAGWTEPRSWTQRARATRDMYQYFPCVAATYPLNGDDASVFRPIHALAAGGAGSGGAGWVAAAASDGRVDVLDLRNAGAPMFSFRPHETASTVALRSLVVGGTAGACCRPEGDGNHLLTLSSRGNARIWDISSSAGSSGHSHGGITTGAADRRPACHLRFTGMPKHDSSNETILALPQGVKAAPVATSEYGALDSLRTVDPVKMVKGLANLAQLKDERRVAIPRCDAVCVEQYGSTSVVSVAGKRSVASVGLKSLSGPLEVAAEPVRLWKEAPGHRFRRTKRMRIMVMRALPLRRMTLFGTASGQVYAGV